jgi:hypothetical protein
MTVQDILEQPTTGVEGKRTHREDFELPNTDLKLEPGLLLDASGSNAEEADPEGKITKVELVSDALPHIVGSMEGSDAEAAREQAGGSSRKGGVRGFMFSYDGTIVFDKGEDESDDERDLHDLNTANIAAKVAAYRAMVARRQMTYVTPALVAVHTAFTNEFGDDQSRAQLILGIGDGRFNDPQSFDEFILKAGPRLCLAFAAIGYGDAHDEFVEHLETIRKKNQYFTYAALTGVSDPTELALDLRLLSGTAPSR